MAHAAGLEYERDTLVEHQAAELERRKSERIAKPKLGIRDDRKRHVLALRELDLRGERLRRQSRDLSAQVVQLACVVAERARLRGTPARAGDRVPAVGGRSSRRAGSRIDVEDCELSAELGEVDEPVGRVEQELRHLEPDEMVGGAVINGCR